jgi:exodeoxyribonuclease VII small subunit
MPEQQTDPKETEARGAEATSDLATFESAVAELESIVSALESGETDLETALSKFERGVGLARQCQTTLKNAQLRVDQLLGAGEDGDSPEIGPEIGEFDLRTDDGSNTQ